MAFNIYLYNTDDPANKINKSLVNELEIPNCSYKTKQEMRSPEILLRTGLGSNTFDANSKARNYAKIGTYYYFVEGYTQERDGFITLHLQLDPLMTWKDEILASPALVARSASAYNLYYADPYLDLLGYKSPDATAPVSPGSQSYFYLVAIGKLAG